MDEIMAIAVTHIRYIKKATLCRAAFLAFVIF